MEQRARDHRDVAITDWDQEIDGVLRGDLTAAVAYTTPLGGAVVTAVAPCGLAHRQAGTVGFTTSIGFGKKLEQLVRDPHVALAYHSRTHGSSTSSRYVLVQGTATVELAPSPERLEAFAPQAVQHLGPMKHGPVWDRLLREYYRERVFVDVSVDRITAWPTLTAAGEPVVQGAGAAPPAEPQPPPRNGTAPRIDVSKAAAQVGGQANVLLAYRGSDGFPMVLPVHLAGHEAGGLRIISAAALPEGGRRAGLLAHSYHPQLVGLSTRVMTGWLSVDGAHAAASGAAEARPAMYAPHTSRGFVALPSKTLLLVGNGLLAKYGMWQARRNGSVERLQQLIGGSLR